MAQGNFHGRFVWQELMTEDTATAAAFYSKVVGWRAEPSAVDATYTQFGIGSAHYAGMMRLPDEARASGAKSQWLPYIGAADVEATMAAAERLGGKVVRPAQDIPTVGRFAMLNDPQGAAFAVFKPAHEGMAGPAETPLGGFGWMELATTNHEAAFDFYSKLFGWQALSRMDMGPPGVYLIFGSDDVQRGGMYKLHQERSPRPYWLAYAAVANIDAAAAAATAAGGRIIVGPMEVPGGGRIAQVIDPSGAMFAVHSAAAAKAAAPKPATKPPAAKPPAPKPATAPGAARPPAAKPAAAAPAPPKPAPAPAKPASTPAPAAKPAAASPAPKKAVPKKAAAKKAAAKKAAAKKAAAKKAAPKKAAAKKRAAKKAPAKKKPAARKASGKKASGKKAAARTSAVKSARKSAKKSARKARRGKRKPAKARRAAGKARRKK
jgi:predicted enzyme related to lactoylglutathione lyase